jgi:hypothetical protein
MDLDWRERARVPHGGQAGVHSPSEPVESVRFRVSS